MLSFFDCLIAHNRIILFVIEVINKLLFKPIHRSCTPPRLQNLQPPCLPLELNPKFQLLKVGRKWSADGPANSIRSFFSRICNAECIAQFSNCNTKLWSNLQPRGPSDVSISGRGGEQFEIRAPAQVVRYRLRGEGVNS